MDARPSPFDDKMKRMRLLAGLLAALLFQTAAFAWGRVGHRVVAQVATLHLSPQARAAIAQLLPPGESLESIANWADEVRPERKETSTWHYINFPISAPAGPWKPFCPDSGCVVQAVLDMQARLADRSQPAAARAEALKFLVHFTADLHQPLHAGDQSDRGGNDIPVVFRNRPTNLHSLWDTPLVLAALDQPGVRARLARPAGRFERRRLQQGDPALWAWQSHDISRDAAYSPLPKARPAVIPDSYVATAAPAIELQLRRAGLRLARLLNTALASSGL